MSAKGCHIGDNMCFAAKKLKLEHESFDDQSHEQLLLREIFLTEIPPTELYQYSKHLGIPEPLVSIICEKHQDLQAAMGEVFSAWYPVAETTSELHNLSPRFVLAKACYQQQNTSAFVRLMDNFFLTDLFKISSELFDTLAGEISAALSENLWEK